MTRESIQTVLKHRFMNNLKRHPSLNWEKVEARLRSKPECLDVLIKMEESGGEPDVIGYDDHSDTYLMCDCSPESPSGRRSLCYDQEALESRKQNKPKHSAEGMALEMGAKLMTEPQYFTLQKLGDFDTKTSSWLSTPEAIRRRGGALFGDKRFGRAFVYHNGAESYYASRGYRTAIVI